MRTSQAIKDDICHVLCDLLKNGVDVHRCFAAKALGRMGFSGAVEALIEALLDEDEDVRADAAGALAQIGDPSAGDQLLENLLGDPISDVKYKAIEALGKMRHAQAVPWLRRLVVERVEEINWDDEEFLNGGWDDWVDIQVQAINILADMGDEEAVPLILKAIDDEFGQDLTELAFKPLAKLGDPGAEALAAFIDDKDERQRRRAATVLGGMDGQVAHDATTRALGDTSQYVRLAALRALAAKSPGDERIAELFDDADSEIRAEATRLCGAQHKDRLPALMADEYTDVSIAAFDLLVEQPDLVDRDVLTEQARTVLRDFDDPNLISVAGCALAIIRPAAAAAELEVLVKDPERPAKVRFATIPGLTLAADDRAVQTLATMIGEDERQIRLDAMVALSKIAAADETWPNPAAEILLSALRGELVAAPEVEEEPDVEEEVEVDEAPMEESKSEEDETEAETEAEIFPQSTLDAILSNNAPAPDLQIVEPGSADVELSEEDLEFMSLAHRTPRKKKGVLISDVVAHQDVPRFAARVLGDLARDEVLLELTELLSHDDKEMRQIAAESLSRLSQQMEAFPADVVDALLAADSGGKRDLRIHLIRALGSAKGSKKALARLIACLDHDDSFARWEAVKTLSKLGAAMPDVERMLADEAPAVRLESAKAMASSGAPDMVGPLVDFAFKFEGYHGRQSARLLQDVDQEGASALFLEVLKDPERKREWQVAIEALEELNEPELNS